MKKFELSARDKTVKASKWGHDFHHTNPQRRVPCMAGDMLCPASADDIPPITQEAMTAVNAALELLANMIGDRDHCLFMGNRDHDGKMTLAAQHVMSARKAIAGILRVLPAGESIEDAPPAVRALMPRTLREAHAVHRALKFYELITSDIAGAKDDVVLATAKAMLARAEGQS